MDATPEQLEAFSALLQCSRRAVVFTGAGISTESGIPDFRGPGGLWTKLKPIEFQDFVASEAVRRESWQRWFEHGQGMLAARPNSGHEAVAALVQRGKVSAVITQNVDNLHQDSGVPAEQVIELHGNATFARCLGCGQRVEMDAIRAQFESTGAVAPCAACGGIIKSATISFGQAMPEEPMERAHEESVACDLFIVLGSSLTVYPAAGFPLLAQRAGARLVIVNQQETDMDERADLVLHSAIGATMSHVCGN